MKKLLLVSGIALFTGINAQTTFGAKAGLNVSTLSGQGDTKSKVGFLAGGLAEIKFNGKMAFQPELLLATGGGEMNESRTTTFAGISFTQNYKQSYDLMNIHVPLMFKYFVTDAFSLEAGPQVGFMVSDKSSAQLMLADEPNYRVYSDFNLADASVTVRDTDGESETMATNFKAKKVNFGLNIGASYQLPAGIFFGARFNAGLTPFVENGDLRGQDDGDAEYRNREYKNSSIQLSVGYKF